MASLSSSLALIKLSPLIYHTNQTRSHLNSVDQCFTSLGHSTLSLSPPQMSKIRFSTPKRAVTVNASYSDDGRSGSPSIFISGFVLGGIVAGTLGCVFAPQISWSLSGAGKKDLMRKLPKFIYDEEEALERKMGERKKEEAKKSKGEWPLIKPKANLSINCIKEDDLFTVRDYLTTIESKVFIKAAESLGFFHQGSLGPMFGEAFRDSGRISVNDPVLADKIWEAGLNKLLSDFKIRGKVAVGLNPNIRFYRYKVGQRFGRHIDVNVDFEGGKRTHYTLLIYLSGGSKPKTKNDKSTTQDSSETLVGGETVFYDSRNSLVAEVAPIY